MAKDTTPVPGENGVPFPPDLPETLREMVQRLARYGYRLVKDGGVWRLDFPAGDPRGIPYVAFSPPDLQTGLLRALREEERRRNVLIRYEQFDSRWGGIVYGTRTDDTTIAAAGCGPSSLAIVLQYLMNNSVDPSAHATVTPEQTARYAATHGRVHNRGTAGDPMIHGIRTQWPEFDGSKVTLDEATGLLEEGKLIIFLCKGCRGWTRHQPPHRDPDSTYGGHYMVLAGVEGPRGPTQMFNVVDPGRNESRAMRLISRQELATHTGGFWWVYRRGEPAARVSTP